MSNPINIFFGTMTGNAESLAQGTYDKITKAGGTAVLHNLADFSADSLTELFGTALFVVSTWGDGEPPTDAEEFFVALSEKSLDLSQLSHAVFGLGDNNYEHFNAFAKNLSARLQELGSPELEAVFSADVVFEQDYADWENRMLAKAGAA